MRALPKVRAGENAPPTSIPHFAALALHSWAPGAAFGLTHRADTGTHAPKTAAYPAPPELLKQLHELHE